MIPNRAVLLLAVATFVSAALGDVKLCFVANPDG
jgi:hypothetical protein